ncbi:MAG: response regulator [Verrucomicrobiota bacterium]
MGCARVIFGFTTRWTAPAANRTLLYVISPNLTILIVEDSPEDQILIRRAFETCGHDKIHLQIVSGGSEAIDYLKGAGKFADRAAFPFPTLVMSDLKMQQGDGFSILEFLHQTPEARVIPVFILSGSADTDDIRRAYALGASGYLTKPRSLAEIKSLVRIIVELSLVCELPPMTESGVALKTESSGKLGERFVRTPAA